MTKLKQTCKIDIRKAIDHYNLNVKDESEERLTIGKLAERLHLTRFILYNMQNGIGRSYVENIEAVAMFCGIKPKEICPVDYKNNN